MSGSNPFRRSKIITSDDSILSIPSSKDDAITTGTAVSTSAVFDEVSKPQSSSNPKVVRIATPLPSPGSDSTSLYFPAVAPSKLGIHRGSPPPEDNGSLSSDESELDPFDPQSSDDVVAEDSSSQRMTGAGPSFEQTSRVSTQPINGKSNNTLDVDAFTRLLLTGSSEAASSNTSVMSDKTTPNTGTNVAGITRTSSLPASIESNQVQRTSSVKRPKPPPPRTRRGKPIKPEDTNKTVDHNEISDSSKPVPPQTPINPAEDRQESISSASSTKILSPTSPLDGMTDDISSLHKSPSLKRPPTPPLARRHSQIKPSTNPSVPDRSNRLSLPPKSLSSQLPGPLSPGMKTPPRPPSRRIEKADTISQTRLSLSQSESPLQNNTAPTDERASPASSSPPSRRQSIKQIPGGSVTAMPPPPPPPRRLRASSKSSNSSAVPAATNAAHDNNTNVQVPSHAEDILADLSRLQREVDSLRDQYEGRRVSQ